jgi:hypothetical protein
MLTAHLLVCLAVPATRVYLTAEENPERVVLQKLDLVGDLLDAVLQNLLHRLALAAVRRGAHRSRRRSGGVRRSDGVRRSGGVRRTAPAAAQHAGSAGPFLAASAAGSRHSRFHSGGTRRRHRRRTRLFVAVARCPLPAARAALAAEASNPASFSPGRFLLLPLFGWLPCLNRLLLYCYVYAAVPLRCPACPRLRQISSLPGKLATRSHSSRPMVLTRATAALPQRGRSPLLPNNPSTDATEIY